MSNEPTSVRLFAEYRPDASGTRETLAAGDLRMVEATAEHVDAIAALLAVRNGEPIVGARERVTRWIDGPRAIRKVLAAICDDVVAGYGRMEYVSTPSDPQYTCVPAGWYLNGVIVDERYRRRGIGSALTVRRLEWVAAQGANEAYYFANSLNLSSIEMHRRLGFEEVMRDFRFPGARFSGGGVGVLYRVALDGRAERGQTRH